MPIETSDILPGVYAGFVSVVLFVLVTAVFVGAETTAQGTLAAAALGSGGLGFFSVNRALATPLRGTLQFTRPWLWFTAFAAAGLYRWPLSTARRLDCPHRGDGGAVTSPGAPSPGGAAATEA